MQTAPFATFPPGESEAILDFGLGAGVIEELRINLFATSNLIGT